MEKPVEGVSIGDQVSGVEARVYDGTSQAPLAIDSVGDGGTPWADELESRLGSGIIGIIISNLGQGAREIGTPPSGEDV